MLVHHYYSYLIIGLLLRISASGWAEDPTMHAAATMESTTNQDPMPMTTTTTTTTVNGSSCSSVSDDQNDNGTCKNPQVESVVDDHDVEQDVDDDDDEGEEESERELVQGDDDDEEFDPSEEEEEEDDDDDDDDEERDEYDDYPLDFNEWGKPQVVRDNAVEERLKMSHKYIHDVFYASSILGRYWCRNEHIACSLWASEGKCEEDRDFMVEHCSPACLTCEEYMEEYFVVDTGDDDDDNDGNDDKNNTDELPTGIEPSLWGVPQHIYATVLPEKHQSIVNATHKYMTETVLPQPEIYSKVYRECQNKYADCTLWATKGNCDSDSTFMHVHCAPACQTCDMLDYDKRCPVPPPGTEVFQKPGDLNAMFQRIVSDPYWNDTYGPIEILSSPETTGGPWIVTLENFASDEECTRFIDLGAQAGYERSEDVAQEDTFFGSLDSVQSEGRTSMNAWCMEECSEDPIVEPVHRRIEKLTGTHFNYSEYYQLLRYEPGQFYEEHHDYIMTEWYRPQGPRILTVFMYLNNVEDGGGTHFGRLNLTVQPKKGKAVIWPSVLDEDPVEWDERTHHEALKVNSGIKYGANAWIHLRDFKTESDKNCV